MTSRPHDDRHKIIPPPDARPVGEWHPASDPSVRLLLALMRSAPDTFRRDAITEEGMHRFVALVRSLVDVHTLLRNRRGRRHGGK